MGCGAGQAHSEAIAGRADRGAVSAAPVGYVAIAIVKTLFWRLAA
jgi:hypothetical protein